MTQIHRYGCSRKRRGAESSKGQRSCKHRVPLKIKIMFLFYETVFYFLRDDVLVIEIVIICFKKHGT
ncbi:hypothetical protein FE241_15265 [Raoultella terrigena]|nr:hypothetical protein [Raoultella terrigena]HCR58135.1 hypothetical protein [Raoultella sp.]